MDSLRISAASREIASLCAYPHIPLVHRNLNSRSSVRTEQELGGALRISCSLTMLDMMSSVRHVSSGACSRHAAITGSRQSSARGAPVAPRPRGTQPTRAIAEAPSRPQSQNGAAPAHPVAPNGWSLDSWKKFQAWQQPNYPDQVGCQNNLHGGTTQVAPC